MDTEEVAAEAPAETATEEKDATSEENKESTTSTDIQDHVTDKNQEEDAAAKEDEEAVIDKEAEEAVIQKKDEEAVVQKEGEEAIIQKEGEETIAEKEGEETVTEKEGEDAVTEKEGEEAETEKEGEDAVTEKEGEDAVTEKEGKDAVTEKEGEEAETENKGEEAETENKGEEAVLEKQDESSKDVDNPSCDWLEPLEEDCEDVDSQSVDGEVESVAGSEFSGSVVLKSTGDRGGRGAGRARRKTQFEADEGWEDWPALGKGWKRKEVFRRSGTSEGRSDTYYISPRGRKVRSRVELTKHIGHSVDLTNFDFKSGQFLGEGARRKPRVRRKMESPLAQPETSLTLSVRSDSADVQRPASSAGFATAQKKSLHSTQNPPYATTASNLSTFVSPGTNKSSLSATTQPVVDLTEDAANPTPPVVSVASEKPVNGASGGPRRLFGVCIRCNKTYSYEEGQTLCKDCRIENRALASRKPYKKWVPCGRCWACQTTVDCGKCVSCRNGRLRHRLNIHSRKVVKCRKRKCLHPVRRERGFKDSEGQFSNMESSMSTEPSVSEDYDESQSSYLQYSDSEDLSVFFEGNDGDNGLDEMGVPKVRRRSCGKCKGCVRRTDCGTCDFCMDKPKFGGRNKKRQKCRLRQCTREAMKHLLPMDEAELLAQGWLPRRRPRYTYGRGTPGSKKMWGFEMSDDMPEQYMQKNSAHLMNQDRFLHPSYNGKAYSYTDVPNSHMVNNMPLYNPHKVETMSPHVRTGQAEMIKENGLQSISNRSFVARRPDVPPTTQFDSTGNPGSKTERNRSQDEQSEGESFPSITQIFSVAGSDHAVQGMDVNHELMPLLRSLRSIVLPVLWFCVVVEGPRLQLLQCSKRSTMADTVIYIEPGFHYHISVQDQPLLPTHKLYDCHPSRLTSAAEIIALIEDLEKHSVCQGSEHKHSSDLVIPERAATCDFLISAEVERCEKCQTLQRA
uniref:methyl-CpG-binding domain protein 1b isoform 1 n=1 Tax=Danio rerio TaxID=7955 RepID=UPI0001A2C0D8